MLENKRSIDKVNSTVILVTFVLFAVALFVKGFTQGLLLEAGVFLVSVKLILGSYQNKILNQDILRKLEEIEKKLDQSRS